MHFFSTWHHLLFTAHSHDIIDRRGFVHTVCLSVPNFVLSEWLLCIVQIIQVRPVCPVPAPPVVRPSVGPELVTEIGVMQRRLEKQER